MTNFYNLPHIFVVFRPGAAGNFISSLLDNLSNQTFNNLKISDSGHVHYNSIVERKRTATDYLSFGSGLLGIDLKFFTVEEKIQYYKDNIDNSDYLNRPYVTWTHAFENIPIYRSLFPNSRILVINDNTLGERLTALIMHVNKNHFNDDDQVPFPNRDRIKPKLFKVSTIKDIFARSYPDKKYQAGYLDLDLSLMYRSFLHIQGLGKYLTCDPTTEIPYEDDDRSNRSLNFRERKAQFSIGRQHIGLATTSIDFANILNKSSDKIIEKFEVILERKLSVDESQYVSTALNEYIQSQNLNIISSPREYLADIKEKADIIVSAF